MAVVLVNVDGLPGVADPDVLDGLGGRVSGGDHVVGELALLGLVLVLWVAGQWLVYRPRRKSTYVKDKDAELGLGSIRAHALTGKLDILLKLLDSVLQSGSGVVNLIDNEDSLADKVLHLTKSSEVKPLGSGDLCTGSLDLVVTERLIEGETNGLDGDVGRVGLLEERSEDSSRDVATTADGDYELRLEFGEELLSRLLAHLVHL